MPTLWQQNRHPRAEATLATPASFSVGPALLKANLAAGPVGGGRTSAEKRCLPGAGLPAKLSVRFASQCLI